MSVSMLCRGSIAWSRDGEGSHPNIERIAVRAEHVIRMLDDVRGHIKWFAIQRYYGDEFAFGFHFETEVGIGGQGATHRSSELLVCSDVLVLLEQEFKANERPIRVEVVQARVLDDVEFYSLATESRTRAT